MIFVLRRMFNIFCDPGGRCSAYKRFLRVREQSRTRKNRLVRATGSSSIIKYPSSPHVFIMEVPD